MSSSTTTMTLIGLNNKGIELFQQENFHSAITCFRSALCMLKQDVIRNCSRKTENKLQLKANTRQESASTGLRSAREQRKLHRLATATSSRTNNKTKRNSPASQSFLGTVAGANHPNNSRSSELDETSLFSRMQLSSHYVASKPIKMSGLMGNNENIDSKSSASIMTVVLVFNMALSHQLLSFTASPKQAAKYQLAAISFYDICIDLRRRRRIVPGAASSLLELCIVNNLAVLHYQMNNDKTRAIQHFRKLACLIQQLNPQQLPHAQGFVGNIVLMSLNKTRGVNTSQLADAA